MDLTLDLLSIQNPWWRGENMKFDPALAQYERQILKWQPEILSRLDLAKGKIYLLAGLKGAGKTTLMKLLIKKLIEQDKVSAHDIFFYSCHNLDSYEQLNEAIKLFLSRKNSGQARRYIFIDEAGLVKDWRSGLDYLIKAGKLKNAVLALSSSSVEGKKIAGDTAITSLAVSTMAFRQFARLINPALFKKITPENYPRYAKKLEYYLDIYFLTGGFIPAVNDFKANGAVRQAVYGDFLHWFLAYVARSGRDAILTRQIMEKLILLLGRPLGYQTLTHKTKAKTHLTAAEYLAMLENMFMVKTVYQTAAASRKAKKIYFQDPFIFWLFYSYIHGAQDYWQFSRQRLHDGAVFSHLVENVILSQLVKDETAKASYWRDNIKKKEINFIVSHRGLTSKQEVKPLLIRYGREIKDTDYGIFKLAGFKKGIIISQNRLEDKSNIKILPLTYFLLFYEKLF